MREVSTEEPFGLGIVGDASRRVMRVEGCFRERERAVETVLFSLVGFDGWGRVVYGRRLLRRRLGCFVEWPFYPMVWSDRAIAVRETGSLEFSGGEEEEFKTDKCRR